MNVCAIRQAICDCIPFYLVLYDDLLTCNLRKPRCTRNLRIWPEF